MSFVQVLDKKFVPYITASEIKHRVLHLAKQIDEDYVGKDPLFIAILNGSFIFAADLFRNISIPAQISFIKLASYKGTSSTGHVITAIGLEEQLNNRHVIILEDIVDTGNTLYNFLPQIMNARPASVNIATLLLKKDALAYPVNAKYIGFEIPNKFVVGYGLDYDGYGRNIDAILQISEGRSLQ